MLEYYGVNYRGDEFMRIISGKAKGRKLLSPIGMETRPTLDRVKQSMFNIIQLKLVGARTLDVFAGTGSLGLESASRGASECVLIDRSNVTYPLLKKNIESLEFTDICKSYNMDSYEALKMLGREKKCFDIIFVDPPYMKDMIPPAIDIILEQNLLDNDGVIVTKIDTKEILYEGNESIVLYDHRKYGNTTVCFYRHKED